MLKNRVHVDISSYALKADTVDAAGCHSHSSHNQSAEDAVLLAGRWQVAESEREREPAALNRARHRGLFVVAMAVVAAMTVTVTVTAWAIAVAVVVASVGDS